IADQHHRQFFVADVQLNLFEHPHRDEGTETVDHRTEAGLGQPGGHADHVLLSDAGVEVLAGTCLAELVEQGIAVVAGQQQYALVATGGADQGSAKGVPHDAPPDGPWETSEVFKTSEVCRPCPSSASAAACVSALRRV